MKRISIGKHVVEWVASQTNEHGNFGTNVGIGLQEWNPQEKAWPLVAGVAYANFNGPNIECHIASDKSKRWLNREYLNVIFDYPFNQAKVNRITVCIGQGNRDSINFVKHLGFERETTLRAAHPTGDLEIWVMWKERCKWISQDFCKRYALAA